MYDLDNTWINDDFINTKSYTPNLQIYCKPYRTYSNYIHYYTIKDEYLIAMKLNSNRSYKYDVSDIIGILAENKKITYDMIIKAYKDLYSKIPDADVLEMLKKFTEVPHNELPNLYNTIREIEDKNKNIIIEYDIRDEENLPIINLYKIDKTI